MYNGIMTGYDDLSEEAKEVAISMIDFCIRHHKCMGMDEGYNTDDTKKQFRIELESFCEMIIGDKAY